MLNSNFNSYDHQGIPPVHLQYGEKLVVQEHNTLFGRKTTYKVVRSSEGEGCVWVIVVGIILAIAGWVLLQG